MNLRALLPLLPLLPLFAGACAAPSDDDSSESEAALTVASGQGFSLDVDPTVRAWRDPTLHRAAGAQPVDFVVDAAGVRSVFVRDEVVIAPQSPSELSAFLTRYGGNVVGNDAVPAPPPQLQRQVDRRFATPTSYVVKVDPARVPPATLRATAPRIGLSGAFRVSSRPGAGLLALATHAAASGFHVAPNFVAEGAGEVFLASQEMPTGKGFLDYLDGFNVAQYATTGSKSGVLAAWQYVKGHGIARRTTVAIIDGGFYLEPDGTPHTDASGWSDLPAAPMQYDFDGDDPIADGENPGECTGGTPCPWHGNGSAGVATGTVDNRTGAAGVGGLVADPMLFKVDLSDGNVKRAVRTAVAWGADVVSMSFGGACNMWCRLGRNLDGYANPFFEARDAGLAQFAAAGNDSVNVVDESVYPCILKAVDCVGALADGTSNAISYSNWPAFFAPTNIPVMPNGLSTPGNTIHGGTSAATPFMAGVAAMVKAIDPSLNGAAVDDLMVATAWKGSGDAKVSYWVNAFGAVSAAAKHVMPPDAFEPNDTLSQVAPLEIGEHRGLSLEQAGAIDMYRITVPAFASLDIALKNDGLLGTVYLKVQREGDKGVGADGDTLAYAPNGVTYHADVVAPGSYLVTISGYAPNVYDLTVGSAPVTLGPDMFEADDTFATAASPAFGDGFEVNFHTTSDVDYYRFDVPGDTRITKGARFTVDASDSPVTVHLLDAYGAEVASSPSAVDLVPGATNWVKVDGGGAIGRYRMSAYATIDRSAFPLYTPYPPFSVHGIGPSDGPWTSHYVSDAPGWLAIDRTPALDSIALYGEGVHATLIDANGEAVMEGVPAPNLQANEALYLANTQPGAYFVRLMRSDLQSGTAPDTRRVTVGIRSLQ